MTRPRVLIVEDLRSLSLAYSAQLDGAGFESIVSDCGDSALRVLRQAEDIDAVLLDLQLPDVDGLDLLRNDPELPQRIPVVVATADGSLSRAIEAMRLGAFDFLVKPVAGGRLLSVVRSAVEAKRSATGPSLSGAPRDDVAGKRSPGAFVGGSAEMRAVYEQISRVAQSRATVFVTGESGTGKEVCAEALHSESSRAAGPFVAINCGAIPENLLESELFGHLKGSFTGAISDRIGAVQAAHKGTLFLDEICEMALPLQVKLLRFLQTGTVQRVGSNRVEDVDVRIVCATNRDPVKEVEEGRFREDLYYRLAVVPVHLPPLRERAGDVRELAQIFLDRFAIEEGKSFAPLGEAQLATLERHTWPGNVRELQNVLRRVAVMCDGPAIPVDAFALGQVERQPCANAGPVFSAATPAAGLFEKADLRRVFDGLTLDEIERIAIECAVERVGGSLPAAARVLGVSPSTLYRKRERWTVPLGAT